MVAGRKQSFPRSFEASMLGKINPKKDAAIITPAEKPQITLFSFLLNSFFKKNTIVAPRVVATKIIKHPKIAQNNSKILSSR